MVSRKFSYLHSTHSGVQKHEYIFLNVRTMSNELYHCSLCVLVAQACLTLFDPVDYSPPGFSVHGIFQARILEWVATPGDLPNPGIEPVPLLFRAVAGGVFTTSPTELA